MGETYRAFEAVFILSEVILIILYLTLTEYGEGVHPGINFEEGEVKNFVQGYYPIF